MSGMRAMSIRSLKRSGTVVFPHIAKTVSCCRHDVHLRDVQKVRVKFDLVSSWSWLVPRTTLDGGVTDVVVLLKRPQAACPSQRPSSGFMPSWHRTRVVPRS